MNKEEQIKKIKDEKVEQIRFAIVELLIGSSIVINRMDEFRNTPYYKADVKVSARKFNNQLLRVFKEESKLAFAEDDKGVLAETSNTIEEIAKKIGKMPLAKLQELEDFIDNKTNTK